MSVPTGHITFLFTDIQDSVQLAQKFPGDYSIVLKLYEESVTAAANAFGGYFFKKTGDACCMAFSKASEAINAAILIQEKKISSGQIDAGIRAGINTGDAEFKGDDYSGYVVLSKVQRILSVSNAGQILASSAVYNEAKDAADDFGFRDLGKRKFKDFSNPERIYQITAEGLKDDFPPLKTLDARPHNIPSQLSVFIGRHKEIRDIKELIRKNNLITISGSGGVGKTRLLIEAALELIDEFENGARLTELAPVTDPGLVSQTLLSVFELKESPGMSSTETLVTFLKDKELLLLLDNCEHVIEGCTEVVTAILKTCPKVKMIITSREALHVPGENIYKLEPFIIPEISAGTDDNIPFNNNDAVKLFYERASAVKTGFTMSDNDALIIAQICARLDGIPLAIELAAARVNILSIEKILEKLKDTFALLRSGSRTTNPRQQTLWTLFDWSYDHLNEKEKLLLCRLSVFKGGWTYELAEKICTDETITDDDMLDLLSNLIDKSLIKLSDAKSGVRYSMLETIRQHANEKLPKDDVIYKKHYDYFSEQISIMSFETDDNVLLDRIKQIGDDMDNVRIALQRSVISSYEGADIFAMNSALMGDWNGNYNEAYGIYSDIMNGKIPCPDPYILACVKMHSGALGSQIGRTDGCETCLLEALEFFKSNGYEKDMAECLDGLGMFYFYTSHPELSEEKYRASFEILKRLDEKRSLINVICNLGALLLFTGKTNEATKYLENGLMISNELNAVFTKGRILQNLGGVYYQKGEHERAIRYYEEALALSEGLGDKNAASVIMLNLGNSYYSIKDYHKAEEFYNEGMKLAETFNYSLTINHFAIRLGDLAMIKGDLEKANEIYIQGLIRLHESSDVRRIASTAFGLSSYYLAKKDHETSVIFLALSERLYEESGFKFSVSKKNEFEHNRLELIKALGSEQYEESYKKGMTLPVEEAIVIAQTRMLAEKR